MTSIKTFNAQGAAIHNDSGVHEYRSEYDENRRAYLSRLLDREGQPVEEPVLGYASVERKYDEAGNQTEQRMYDAQEQVLCVRKLVYENGKNTVVYYEDGDGEPLRYDEYYKVQMEYDRFGNCCKEAYYDTDGELILRSEGNAAIERDYDDYGTENEPILRNGEYHELRWEFDEQNNVVRQAYYGTDGTLIMTGDGYAVLEIDYDEDRNVIAQRFYGADNEPILYGAFHEIRWKYDEDGNEIWVGVYDAEGNLVEEENYE